MGEAGPTSIVKPPRTRSSTKRFDVRPSPTDLERRVPLSKTEKECDAFTSRSWGSVRRRDPSLNQRSACCGKHSLGEQTQTAIVRGRRHHAARLANRGGASKRGAHSSALVGNATTVRRDLRQTSRRGNTPRRPVVKPSLSDQNSVPLMAATITRSHHRRNRWTLQTFRELSCHR